MCLYECVEQVCVSVCVCVCVCVCACVCVHLYKNDVFVCVVRVHASPTVCRVSNCNSIRCPSSGSSSLNSAYVYAEYTCGWVGGQGSQCTQTSHTLTYWSWETLKSHNVWCFV